MVPKELANITMIMIPKANSEKLRGIGIIDIVWKLIAYMIKSRLEKKISMHEDIHGFREGRGTADMLCAL